MPKIEKTVFIGSSSEGRGIADIVSEALTRSNSTLRDFSLEPCLWDFADWKYNFSLFDSLYKFPKKYDYSIFIFAPDDTVISRDEPSKRVRDNVLFEFALFVAQKDGIEKTFFLHPKDKDFVLASDIMGIHAPEYVYSDKKEILKNRINQVVTKIVESIDNFEKSKLERSKLVGESSIKALKNDLEHATNEQERVFKIKSALRELVDIKGEALNQSASEVLFDILSWTNTLLDIVDPNQLIGLQREGLLKVWVYSPNPIEFSESISGELFEKFKNTVVENLKNGVKYTYFVDSNNIFLPIRKLGKKFPNLIDVCMCEPHCLTSNFAIHFYSDDNFDVYQNIVRKGKLELLVKLDIEDAKLLVAKIQSQYEKLISREIDGIRLYEK